MSVGHIQRHSCMRHVTKTTTSTLWADYTSKLQKAQKVASHFLSQQTSFCLAFYKGQKCQKNERLFHISGFGLQFYSTVLRMLGVDRTESSTALNLIFVLTEIYHKINIL